MWFVTITSSLSAPAKKFLVSEAMLPHFLETVKSASIAFEFIKIWEPPAKANKEATSPLVPLSQS